jgi:hypothetical protein
MKKNIRILLAAILAALLGAVAFYITLPAINVYSQDFWMTLTVIFLLFGGIYFLLGIKSTLQGMKSKQKFFEKGFHMGKLVAILVAIPVVVLALGSLLSSTVFHAKEYSQIITVEEAVFEEDMPETDLVSNIALMDSASANVLGDRTLGALSDVVSQYQVNGSYYQINYHGLPEKVSSLEYVDFFRWWNNHENGIPGYVMVDPVNSSAEYLRFAEPIRYTDSAYFEEDLNRKLRFSYPTKIFGNVAFEIDEEGKPYYIVACMQPKIGLFGAMDVNEVIIFNPCTGESELYALADTPSWVDNVFTGTLAAEKYDWHGMLKNGYWNSVIGKKDCKVTTDDFGYIMIEDDVWFFTGVTSVSSDEYNIGFLISNARTGSYKFYPVIGAEEYSAMGAAQGEVQEKGYVASFPSLINVSGEATYIMVLKDANGLVKLYALVNVENYSIVATGTTQKEAKEAYIRLLKQENLIGGDTATEEAPPETLTTTIEVVDLRTVTVDGQTVMYLSGSDGNLYKQTVAADEALMLVKVGDSLTVSYHKTEIDRIHQIVSWSFYTEAVTE